MSVNGRCKSDFSPLKCDGINIPSDCSYALSKETLSEKRVHEVSLDRYWYFEEDVKEKIQEFLKEMTEEVDDKYYASSRGILKLDVKEIINKKAEEKFGKGLLE